jgi:hypothetical protein
VLFSLERDWCLILLILIPPDGPVLSTTELYLLQTELQLNPILTNSNPGFHLIFHLQTGKQSRLSIDTIQAEHSLKLFVAT